MGQILIGYTGKHLPRKKQTRVRQKLFGYLDQSKHSRYYYRRNELLLGKIIKKIKPGCLLVAQKQKKEIGDILKKKPQRYDLYVEQQALYRSRIK